MEAHRSVRLRDICKVQIGYTARRRISRAAQDGILTVQLRDVPPNGSVDPARLVRLQVDAVPDRYLVGAGDVLFRSRSEANTASVLDDRFCEPALAMLPLYILRPRQRVVLPEFVAWAINQPRAQRHFDRFARGTNMRMVPRAVLTGLEIALPAPRSNAEWLPWMIWPNASGLCPSGRPSSGGGWLSGFSEMWLLERSRPGVEPLPPATVFGLFSVRLIPREHQQHGGCLMGQRTSIEWTEVTWNPTTGCTKVSEGCDNCYADVLSRRLLSAIYCRRLPVVNTATNLADPFAVRIWPERLAQPAGWRGRRLVFVNSMSDLFHCDIPVDFLRAVFEVMLDVNRHTYQVLTKRPSRAARFVRRSQEPRQARGGLPQHRLQFGGESRSDEGPQPPSQEPAGGLRQARSRLAAFQGHR